MQLLDEKELNFLKQNLADKTVVFSHNDLYYSNILVLLNDDIEFIDFEYSNYNYRSYDIANFFIEQKYDYGLTVEPFFSTNHEILTTEEMEEFLNSYVDRVF